jgi:indole-3-glycerol phosphate synthase
MSVLNRIAQVTRERVAAEQALIPLSQLEARLPASRQPQDFIQAFAAPGFNVIAEVKLASPSKGPIAPNLKPLDVAADYLSHGAAALSVLTEPSFFKGRLEYLESIRQAQPDARLLMKDFMLDPYQFYQARMAGADACLLIVAMLEPKQLESLYALALELKLTPLVEVHTAAEMQAAVALGAKLIGVNNRNLKTLETDLATSRELASLAPAGTVLICESGLSQGHDLSQAKSWGYSGFLIGSHLMATGLPGPALAALLQEAQND